MASCAVIPCYNVGELCGDVIKETSQCVDRVLVIDDGSTDSTAAVIRETGASMIQHPTNQGKGHALMTAFRTILEDPAYADVDEIITLDGDGQHTPMEIFKLREYCRGEANNLVIGSRNVLRADVPFRRRLGNGLSAYVISVTCRQTIPDSQSGFRLFSRETLQAIMPYMRGGRYESETLFIIVAARLGFTLVNAPITTIYNEAAEATSNFGPVRDTFRCAKVILYYAFLKPYRKWHESRS